MNKLSFSWQNQMEKNGNEDQKISTVLVCLFWLPCNNMCKTVKIKLSSLVLLGLWLVQTCLKRTKHFLKWFYLSKTAQKWKGRHPTGNCRVSFLQLNRFHAWEISNKENMYISFVIFTKTTFWWMKSVKRKCKTTTQPHWVFTLECCSYCQNKCKYFEIRAGK